MKVTVIILAAGAGSRMRSLLPKVLQPLAGKPLLGHIFQTLNKIPSIDQCHLVVGHEAQKVENYSRSIKQSLPLSFTHQQEQLGTGHAVLQALPALPDDGVTIILYGDVPLIKANTLENLVAKVSEQQLCLLTQTLKDPKGYGRIIREQGSIKAIVEEKDATIEQRTVNEINTGIMAVSNAVLKKLLPKISNQNQQKEYYLTDLIALSDEENIAVEGISVEDPMEVQGVNDKVQLAKLERDFQREQANKLLHQGVTLIDPSRFDCRGDITVGKDVVIDVNCVFQGHTTLGDNVHIGPNCVIGEVDQILVIDENVEIKASSIIESGHISANCTIGPFARIRPETTLHKGVKIGNFVEVKKSNIGEGAKVSHLSYIGDAKIGKNVNIGAGTITCNYDGVNKSQTEIGEGAFIGSNSSLVAPIKIGAGSVVGAGSTITRKVENEQLAIARGKQRNIDNWPKPEKK